MNYTTLSLADVRAGLEDVARDAHTAFGALDGVSSIGVPTSHPGAWRRAFSIF